MILILGPPLLQGLTAIPPRHQVKIISDKNFIEHHQDHHDHHDDDANVSDAARQWFAALQLSWARLWQSPGRLIVKVNVIIIILTILILIIIIVIYVQQNPLRTNLYIRGLSPHTTDKDLVNLCQK